MTEAEARIQQRALVEDESGFVSSVPTFAASWVAAALFLAWTIGTPPLRLGGSPLVNAAVRGLFGILVIAVIRLRPVALGLAWGITLPVAVYGAYHWVANGIPPADG